MNTDIGIDNENGNDDWIGFEFLFILHAITVLLVMSHSDFLWETYLVTFQA